MIDLVIKRIDHIVLKTNWTLKDWAEAVRSIQKEGGLSEELVKTAVFIEQYLGTEQ